MLRKIENIPMTNILIDEQTSDTGLDTRIESFIDIINERRKTNEQYN
jgi:predicted nucleotide-binding protein (sugar kinase/HSP70/actin superfamily)